jgi:hypothetical protein
MRENLWVLIKDEGWQENWRQEDGKTGHWVQRGKNYRTGAKMQRREEAGSRQENW